MATGQKNFDTYFYRLLFRLKILEASGNEFQNLVSQILEWSIPDFQRIAPWGNTGDGGNDGWVPETGHYYQIYGPEINNNWKPSHAAKKAHVDFQKLLHNWPNVRNYFFVLNDRYRGVPAIVADCLQSIQKKYHLDGAQVIDTKKLTDFFMELSDDKKCMITGNIPCAQPDFIDDRAIGELLAHLADKPSRSIGFLHGLPPDFDQKIILNGLTEHIANILRVSSYQTSSVDEFLKTRGAGLQQSIAEEIRQLYVESKSAIVNVGADTADLRFVWLSHKLIPDAMCIHTHTYKAYELASYAILAKYFETCDAYEHPSGTYTT
jgi:hypothetical protein